MVQPPLKPPFRPFGNHFGPRKSDFWPFFLFWSFSHWNSHWSRKKLPTWEGVELQRKQNMFWDQWSNENNLGTCTIWSKKLFPIRITLVIQYHVKPCMSIKHFLPVLLSSDGRLCLTPVCVAATIIRNHSQTRTHLCLHYIDVAHNQRSGNEDDVKGSLLMIRCPLQIWRSDSRLSCLAWEDLVLLRWFFSCGISYLWGGIK